MQYELETLASDGNLCGEAPTWDAAGRAILWVDADSALVFRLSLSDKKKRVISRGLPVAGIALNRNGGMIFAGAAGLHIWRGKLVAPVPVADLFLKKCNSRRGAALSRVSI